MNQKLISSVTILASLIGFISCQISQQTETCLQCTSANDINCSLSPMDMVGGPCGINNTVCFTHIVNGHVVRGCAESLTQDVIANCSADISDCETCIQISALPGVPCNNRVFPQNRLHCHQCQGHLNTTCGTSPITNPIMCPLFSRDDRCFTRRNGEDVIRGCQSSPNSCPLGRCLLCSGNGCNSLNGTASEIPDERSAVGHKANGLMLAFATVFSVFAIKRFL